MRIEVFKNFELVDMLFEFTSFRGIRRYRGAGEFELVLPDLYSVDTLEIGNLFLVNQDFYIIENYSRYKNIDNQLRFEVSGRQLTSILDRRIISSLTINTSQTYEQQMYALVQSNFVNPTDVNRKIDGFVNEGLKGLSQTPGVSYTLENMTILDALSNMAVNAGLGFKVWADFANMGFVFEVYEGNDKTEEVFFSEDFGNILDSEIYIRTSDTKNVAYLKNGSTLTVVGNASGINRKETIVIGNEAAMAEEELSRRKEIASAECQIALTQQFVYKQDWDLGDTVSFIDKKLGFIVEKPILEIAEYYTDKLELEVVFGDKEPTLIDKLKGRW
ncbi:MAG: hypothetical protein EOM00_14900 [Clostridia bacterium]|nr:hypothetical protein [Clostridia bacterium]